MFLVNGLALALLLKIAVLKFTSPLVHVAVPLLISVPLNKVLEFPPPIARLPFKPIFEQGSAELTKKSLDQFHFADLRCNRLVFVNGQFSAELSTILPQKPGVKLGSLAAALAEDAPGIRKHVARLNGSAGNPFAALNTAFFLDG